MADFVTSVGYPSGSTNIVLYIKSLKNYCKLQKLLVHTFTYLLFKIMSGPHSPGYKDSTSARMVKFSLPNLTPLIRNVCVTLFALVTQ